MWENSWGNVGRISSHGESEESEHKDYITNGFAAKGKSVNRIKLLCNDLLVILAQSFLVTTLVIKPTIMLRWISVNATEDKAAFAVDPRKSNFLVACPTSGFVLLQKARSSGKRSHAAQLEQGPIEFLSPLFTSNRPRRFLDHSTSLVKAHRAHPKILGSTKKAAFVGAFYGSRRGRSCASSTHFFFEA